MTWDSDTFNAREERFLAACTSWRERERRLPPDVGLAALFLGSLGAFMGPFTAIAVIDGRGAAYAVGVAFLQMVCGAVLAVVGLPFHLRRRAMNPRPSFKEC